MSATRHSRARQAAPAVTDDEARALHAYLLANAAGQAHALPARTLSQQMQLGRDGDRTLRAWVHRAADLGLLICADNRGYFIPANPDEVKTTVARLRSQAAQMNDRARQIEQLADKHFYARQMALL